MELSGSILNLHLGVYLNDFFLFPIAQYPAMVVYLMSQRDICSVQDTPTPHLTLCPVSTSFL